MNNSTPTNQKTIEEKIDALLLPEMRNTAIFTELLKPLSQKRKKQMIVRLYSHFLISPQLNGLLLQHFNLIEV